MNRKRTSNHEDRETTKALVFEQALHRWPKWSDSIVHRRKILRRGGARPLLDELRSVAGKSLAEMDFPPCTVLELYWLTCVFADYKTKDGLFEFERLVLPEWFPLPFGFRDDSHLEFRGKRIYPPEVWDKADVKFWFERDPLARILSHSVVVGTTGIHHRRMSPARKEEYLKNYPDNDSILVLPRDHPVRKLVKKGRPITTNVSGETYVD